MYLYIYIYINLKTNFPYIIKIFGYKFDKYPQNVKINCKD